MMKRFLLPALAISLAGAADATVTFPVNTLQYEVMYHCGFIKIPAGVADINLSLDGENFMATLNGQTEPIGGRIYAISDTLQARMTGGEGLSREMVTYENGWYTKPRVERVNGSALVFDNPDSYKSIRGAGYLSASSETMEAVTITADMLGLFYYFQEMDFGSMNAGDNINMTVWLPNGDTQQVRMVYEGPDTFEGLDTYRMICTYSYHGVMSNFPVTVQIDSTTRLPLQFSSDIKIGRVELRMK